MSETGHLPVLVEEVADNLIVSLEGAYLDLTVGLGGHLKALSLNVSEKARLYGVDRDSEALKIAADVLEDCSQLKNLICASYDEIDEVVEVFIDRTFDGILLDLGISSMQIDNAQRGFSFQSDGPLDMRFDQKSGDLTASDLINNRSENELADIFYQYGEEKRARRLAAAIVRERQKKMILTTAQLAEIIRNNSNPPYQTKTMSRIFQALRIAVNGELDKLENVLPKLVELLNDGGRLAVLTYHSLEDRIIKRFFSQMVKGCICPPDYSVCLCNKQPVFKLVTRKAIKPTKEELELNSRSRSAKLRIAEKI